MPCRIVNDGKGVPALGVTCFFIKCTFEDYKSQNLYRMPFILVLNLRCSHHNLARPPHSITQAVYGTIQHITITELGMHTILPVALHCSLQSLRMPLLTFSVPHPCLYGVQKELLHCALSYEVFCLRQHVELVLHGYWKWCLWR